MKLGSSRSFALILAGIAFLSLTCVAQKSGNASRPSSLPTSPPPAVDTTAQPTYISGRVIFDGGGAPSEPIVIERVCSGTVRREGYTDSNGHFQFQLGQNIGFHDASEGASGLLTPDRTANTRQSPEMRRMSQLQGCELRAILAGFQSTTAPIRTEGNNWQIEVGTIFLKRMANVDGATISMTTMNAPKEARQAFEKGQKAYGQNKLPEAEKDLEKATSLYPNFASAWSLLGDVHMRQNLFDQAQKEYQQAVAADPQFVNPNFGLTLIAVQGKKWQDAAQLSRQVLKMNAYAYPAAFFYNAVANYYLERFEIAEESGRRFKSLDTEHKHPDILLLLSELRARKNDFSGAAQEMRDYLTLVPDASNAAEIKAQLQRFEDLSLAKKQ